ncbi:MAG: YHYH protein [Opitutae bacterium]|nr:YHYH protein [Opitutae bacterium]
MKSPVNFLSVCLIPFLSFIGISLTLPASVAYQVSSLPTELDGVKSVFTKYVSVYGLHVLASSNVSDAKVIHTANVLAEYLDNNEDGIIDQYDVLQKLLGNSSSEIATMVLFASESEQNSLVNDESIFENTLSRAQNLFADEIFENGSSGDDRDATLEEVLHLVTDKGWDEALPDTWGERQGSAIAGAMDTARGGYFQNVPQQYPQNAWYTYYDETADYGTQVTEYVYWATTTYLEGQNWQGRNHSEYTSEWQPYTKAMLESTDPAVVSILTSSDYSFPVVQLPEGNYSIQNLRAQADIVTADGWKKSPWLGYFYDSGSNWIYHDTFGWMYVYDPGDASTWLYHLEFGWMWSRPDTYPWLYFDKLSAWRYFLSSYGFYNPSDSSWTSTANFSVDSSDTDQATPLIGRIILNQNSIIYYQEDSTATDGWSKVAEESSATASGELAYLQGDSSFERRARLIVSNYRTQVAAGGPITLVLDGQSSSNQLTIEKDSANDHMVVTGNGLPNYTPTVIGVEVTNGWNSAANGGFQSLKLSEDNLGSSGGNNPNQILEAQETFRIPLNPLNNSTATDTPLGTVGLALNGVPIYNPFEDPNETAAYGRIFSGCCGHPQRNGIYHYHKYPTCLRLLSDTWKSEKEKCDELDALLVENGHSPLIGFADDGWPIYGPVGWRNDGSKTGVVLLSSYTGSSDSSGNAAYVEGSGDLDDCNGLVSPTPEFPEGIYHYVMTIEADEDGTVLRYINPHFGYDVRNTLKKHDLMPDSWTDDSTYIAALKSGFTVNGVSVSGTNNFDYFADFISALQSTLNSNGMSEVGAEFETMKIAYPFTIRKYRGTPSSSG